MPASPVAIQQQNRSGSQVPTSKAKSVTAQIFLVLTRHYRKLSPNQTAGLADPGTGAEAALGTYLVSVAGSEGLLHLWPAALGQAAPRPHGREDIAANLWGMCNRQQIQLPCPIPAGWHAVLRARGLCLLPSAAERKGRAGKDPLGTSRITPVKRPGNLCTFYVCAVGLFLQCLAVAGPSSCPGENEKPKVGNQQAMHLPLHPLPPLSDCPQ